MLFGRLFWLSESKFKDGLNHLHILHTLCNLEIDSKQVLEITNMNDIHTKRNKTVEYRQSRLKVLQAYFATCQTPSFSLVIT